LKFQSGFVALIGSPNVGKSTLMNALIGVKVAIVTPRAQTTRNKVTGILSTERYQVIFLDTPGLHTPKNRLGQYMVKTAQEARRDVDLVLMGDEGIIEGLVHEPGFAVALNKVDAVPRDRVDAICRKLETMGVKEYCPVSALKKTGLDTLMELILRYLPEGPKYYPEDMVTDRPERFIACELIREKALINLEDEIPHGIGVEIEQFEDGEELVRLSAVIYCERDSHKGIVIGKKGGMLKRIGSQARVDLEMLFGVKVFLQLWVKVKPDWRNSPGMLRDLGYRE